MENMDVTQRLARRLKSLREERGWSLDALAARSGVSRSNISLVERGRSSPTAIVLDKLSAGLGVTLASLFEAPPVQADAPSPLARVNEQPVWKDPGSGYLRRNVSPAAPSPIQLVDVRFPAGQHVAYEAIARDDEVHQQVWMIDGEMVLTVGDATWRLGAGDCLAMTLDAPIAFHNPGPREARYLVALSSRPRHGPRRAP
jgi:transcriptional regulator with XRE-family HTH domain